MTTVQDLGLTTVANKEQFLDSVIIKECPGVGRSLVTKKPLTPGDVVLVEEPLIKYRLNPSCRSSNSPYYSKKLWNNIMWMVQSEEGYDEDKESVYSNSSADSSYSDDSDDDNQTIQSDFCPGVPAAILAYLDLYPPFPVKNQRKYNKQDFEFFYYPNLDHPTVQLIRSVTQKVVDTEPLFSHVDPQDLCQFVLKIYANAHTVTIPSLRNEPTHSKRKARRLFYQSKFGESTSWGSDDRDTSSMPTIALLRWGSKFAHSCSPNMFLRYEPTKNVMIFTVIRPVKEGEVLSFSYLPEDDSTVGGLLCGSTEDRQAKLEKFKFFTCACERCSDWDWSRSVNCPACGHDCYPRLGQWKCFECERKYEDKEIEFLSNEQDVVQTVIGFITRVYGGRRLDQNTMSSLEPQLMDMLDGQVPKHHWTYSLIHSLLAAYHLQIFPQIYGKGLASQLGLTAKGIEEALVYIDFLNNVIFKHANPKSTSHGNPMTAFFASWKLLAIVIDLVMDNTVDKYANKESIVLIPLDKEWIEPLCKITDIIHSEWLPLIEQIFPSQRPVVIEDMIRQLQAFHDRVQKTK